VSPVPGDSDLCEEPYGYWLKVVSLNFTSWNQLEGWLRGLEALRQAA
jgi:hypothetical protein